MNKDIVMSRELLKRLVIIDKSLTTYNAYKSKFFRVLNWCLDNTVRVRQYSEINDRDRELLDVVDILDSLAT